MLLTGLFFVGLVAGFIDSIAGGGGLITLPALLSLGLPPQVALDTNKFQSSFGSFSAAYNFVRAGKVDLREAALGIFFTLLGALLGTWCIEQLEPDFLKQVIPFLLILILLYTVFSPQIGQKDSGAHLDSKIFYLIFGTGLGFYDGFFGPGTGSFWAMAYMAILGFNMTKATAYTKVMNFISNIVSLFVFLSMGSILLGAGLSMGIGQVIGAKLGTSLVLEKGTKLIKPVFITVVFLTVIRLIYQDVAKSP